MREWEGGVSRNRDTRVKHIDFDPRHSFEIGLARHLNVFAFERLISSHMSLSGRI